MQKFCIQSLYNYHLFLLSPYTECDIFSGVSALPAPSPPPLPPPKSVHPKGDGVHLKMY